MCPFVLESFHHSRGSIKVSRDERTWENCISLSFWISGGTDRSIRAKIVREKAWRHHGQDDRASSGISFNNYLRLGGRWFRHRHDWVFAGSEGGRRHSFPDVSTLGRNWVSNITFVNYAVSLITSYNHLFSQSSIFTPVNTSTNNQSIVYGHTAMFIALSNGDYAAPCLTFDAPNATEVSSKNSVNHGWNYKGTLFATCTIILRSHSKWIPRTPRR